MKKHISKSLAAAFLSLFGLSSNFTDVAKSMDIRPKVIKSFDYDVPKNRSGQAIVYDKELPLNILVIGAPNSENEVKQLMALLCFNQFKTKVSEMPIANHREGKVYELSNQPNIRVVYFNVNHFNDQKFMRKEEYDLAFITRNTNIVLYVMGKNKDCCKKLEDFYHTFNHWWCGDLYDYDNNRYDPLGNREKWFRDTLKAMKLEDSNHRYMYFLYYGTFDERKQFFECTCKWDDKNNRIEATDPNCKHLLEFFVARMPDARSIVGDCVYEGSSIDQLVDRVFGEGEVYHPNENFNDKNIRGKIRIPFFHSETHGTGFEKKNFP